MTNRLRPPRRLGGKWGAISQPALFKSGKTKDAAGGRKAVLEFHMGAQRVIRPRKNLEWFIRPNKFLDCL